MSSLGEVDHARPAHQQKHRAREIISNSHFPKKPWLSVVTEANTTITWLVLRTSSSEAAAAPKPAM
jgi:hypothetical protein